VPVFSWVMTSSNQCIKNVLKAANPASAMLYCVLELVKGHANSKLMFPLFSSWLTLKVFSVSSTHGFYYNTSVVNPLSLAKRSRIKYVYSFVMSCYCAGLNSPCN
jgi:hypothetical protein